MWALDHALEIHNGLKAWHTHPGTDDAKLLSGSAVRKSHNSDFLKDITGRCNISIRIPVISQWQEWHSLLYSFRYSGPCYFSCGRQHLPAATMREVPVNYCMSLQIVAIKTPQKDGHQKLAIPHAKVGLAQACPSILLRVMATIWLLSWLSCLFGLAATSHFQGAIIQWRPTDAAQFDGTVSSNYFGIDYSQ